MFSMLVGRNKLHLQLKLTKRMINLFWINLFESWFYFSQERRGLNFNLKIYHMIKSVLEQFQTF